MSNTSALSPFDDYQRKCQILIGVLLAIVVYCYWNTIVGTAVAWDSPMYNHGYLVPGITLAFLMMRKQPFQEVSSKERWVGVAVVAAAMVVRVLGSYLVQFTIDRLSLIICLLGLVVFVGGFKALKWAGPPILFLVFMFPLPGVMVDKILRPMQTMATMSSVYALQTFGIDVYREGNRILLENKNMNVVDQCSGLRMSTIFVALSFAIAMLYNHRPWWERICVVLSSIPIALLVNCIRITLIGLLYSLNVNDAIVDKIFHDFAGIIMMPLAIGLLFLEMHILSRLVIEDAPPQAMRVGIGKTA